MLMPDPKHFIVSVSTLFLLSLNTILASEYPAPPGHYGQDKILQNSTFNTGKGAPYLNILPADETGDDKTANNANIPTEHAMKPERKAAQPTGRVIPSLTAAPMPAAATAPEPVALPMTAQPVYSPAPETAPSRFQEQTYPDADDLSLHYKISRQLPFDQWGEQLPETHQQPDYDYPPVQPSAISGYPAAAHEGFRGSPDLANQMFNPQANHQANRGQTYKSPKRNSKNFFNPGSFPVDMPVDMMDQFWGGRNSGFMPPANNRLKTFDQFPVPQNIYGPSTMNPPVQTGNRQYFRQIPKEEIIYPPHYPGNRQ